jgi:hypothetical protein
MGVTAWAKFRREAEVKERLLGVKNIGLALNQGALTVEGGQYMGSIDNFNIYVYGGWYVDTAGVEQPIFPAKAVLLTSELVEGVRAFGAIETRTPAWALRTSKSWKENDPSKRFCDDAVGAAHGANARRRDRVQLDVVG